MWQSKPPFSKLNAMTKARLPLQHEQPSLRKRVSQTIKQRLYSTVDTRWGGEARRRLNVTEWIATFSKALAFLAAESLSVNLRHMRTLTHYWYPSCPDQSTLSERTTSESLEKQPLWYPTLLHQRQGTSSMHPSRKGTVQRPEMVCPISSRA